MSMQGFGPILGATYRPAVRAGGNIHTISDLHASRDDRAGSDVLAQQVSELRQTQEEVDQAAQKIVEDLRDCSALVADMRGNLGSTAKTLESALDQSIIQQTTLALSIEKIEEINRKNAQALADLDKGSLMGSVYRLGNYIKKWTIG